jgi:NADH:ubiquinone oxidoreductase subunit 5 (subunit L)/multisubunit Na+/H+ antiporter MnhA subunit
VNLLFDWMSLLFMGFVFVISSLAILYSGDYISGDWRLFRFIMPIFIFFVSMVFLIVSPS